MGITKGMTYRNIFYRRFFLTNNSNSFFTHEKYLNLFIFKSVLPFSSKQDAALISNGSLTISNISRHNESQYACVASNALGSIHTNIFLKVVWPPKFLENVYGSTNMEAVKGEDVYFDCKTDGKPRGEVSFALKKIMFAMFFMCAHCFINKESFTLRKVQYYYAWRMVTMVRTVTENVHFECNRQSKELYSHRQSAALSVRTNEF